MRQRRRWRLGIEEKINLGVLMRGFNRPVEGGTRPEKGRVPHSVNSASPSEHLVKYSSHCSQADLCKSIHLCSRCSLYRFAVFHSFPPHTPRSSRCHPTRLSAGGAIVSTCFRSAVFRAWISGSFVFPRSRAFQKISSQPQEQSNEPGVAQRGTSRA